MSGRGKGRGGSGVGKNIPMQIRIYSLPLHYQQIDQFCIPEEDSVAKREDRTKGNT